MRRKLEVGLSWEEKNRYIVEDFCKERNIYSEIVVQIVKGDLFGEKCAN
jgi:hypothetical protein